MDSFAELFALVLDLCKNQISDVAFNLWLKGYHSSALGRLGRFPSG